MTPDDYNFLCTAIRDRSGLVLNADKAYLVESRLAPIARRRQKTLIELVAMLRHYADPALVREIVEAMATHETFFFRDTKPFEQFRKIVLPALVKARAGERKLRIWSAACSTGQEPYSLAMILKEEAELLRGWRVEITATDFSTEILSRAERGTFSQFEVQRGLPVQMMLKYFHQTGDVWQIDPGIRSAVQFSRQNLLEDFGSLGRFDIVFCRNVLIYFDQKTKGEVLGRLARVAAPDGFLFLGGAETIIGLNDAFTSVPGQSGLFARGPLPAQPTPAPLAARIGVPAAGTPMTGASAARLAPGTPAVPPRPAPPAPAARVPIAALARPRFTPAV